MEKIRPPFQIGIITSVLSMKKSSKWNYRIDNQGWMTKKWSLHFAKEALWSQYFFQPIDTNLRIIIF